MNGRGGTGTMAPSGGAALAREFERNIGAVYAHWTRATPPERHRGWTFLYSGRDSFGPAARIVVLGLNPCPILMTDGRFGELGSYRDTDRGVHPFYDYVRAIRGAGGPRFGLFASNVGILFRAIARHLPRKKAGDLLEESLISNFCPIASDRFQRRSGSAERGKTYLFPAPAMILPTPPGAPFRPAVSLDEWATLLWRSLLVGNRRTPAVLAPRVVIAGGSHWREVFPRMGIHFLPGRNHTAVTVQGRPMELERGCPHLGEGDWRAARRAVAFRAVRRGGWVARTRESGHRLTSRLAAASYAARHAAASAIPPM
jgi:hypothetical protein